jgi:hypothetical protein
VIQGGQVSNTRKRFLVLAAVTVYLGCATAPYQVSAPEALPSGVPGKLDESGSAELRLPGVRMVVAAVDQTQWDAQAIKDRTERPDSSWVSWWRPDVPPFAVFLLFEPMTPHYAFNPMALIVHLPDGGSLSPTGYVGPGTIAKNTNTSPVQEHCSAPKTGIKRILYRWIPLPRRNDAHSYELPPRTTCFVVAFETRVEPPRSIDLQVDGITNAGVQSPPVRLRFSRREARATRGFVYVRPSELQ